MSDDSLVPRPKQMPSFEEFKEALLQYGADGDFLTKVLTLHGKIPRVIRILQNFDRTGLTSAVDQLINEEKSEREKESILRAIYDLAILVWNVKDTELPSLSNDQFCFLYFVYVKSETDIFRRVELDNIQNFMSLPQLRIISIGEYLNKYGSIKFNSWVEGVKIAHHGILRIETDLLGSDDFPTCVDANDIRTIEERIRLRFQVLQFLNRKTKGDTFKSILHTDIATQMRIDYDSLISQVLPYMVEEGWMNWNTNDSIRITEEGIHRVEALLTQ